MRAVRASTSGPSSALGSSTGDRFAGATCRTGAAIGRCILALLGFGVAGCGSRSTVIEQANAANMLLLGNHSEPSDLDPQVVTGTPESRLVQALFEGLVRYHPETLDPLPGVAERWTLAEDGVTYTFHLRADARWSDGRPVTAHDFYGSYQRLLSPELASENVEQLFFLAGGEAYHRGETTDFSTVGCRVIDDHTLELRAARPTPFLLRMMSGRNWFPVPLHVLAQHDGLRRQGSRWTRPENFVGNGPFVLRVWRPNQMIEVERSPTHWGRDTIALDRVRFFPIENQGAEEAAYRAEQLHRTNAVPVQKIDTYRRERPEELHIAPYSGTYYYCFNTLRPPFADARVRRAFALALDREAITRDIARGGEQPAARFTPDGVAGYQSSAPGVRLDAGEARRLLAEAGYPEGAGFPEVTLLYNTADNHRVIAEAAQQMWKRVLGVEVRLENQEWKVYLDSTHLGNFDLCRAGYIVAPDDPTRFLEAFRTGHGFNHAQWSDSRYDELLRAALEETDPVARREIFTALEERLNEAMPVSPIYHYTNSYLLRPEVKNWTDNLLDNFPLREVRLEP